MDQCNSNTNGVEDSLAGMREPTYLLMTAFAVEFSRTGGLWQSTWGALQAFKWNSLSAGSVLLCCKVLKECISRLQGAEISCFV